MGGDAGFLLGTLAGWSLENLYLSLGLAYIATRVAVMKKRGWAIILPYQILRLTRTKIWRRNTTNIYKTMPLRMASRCWGWANEIPVWRPLRRPFLGLYVWAFDCNMAEAEVEDLAEYANLSALFNRTLKPGLRPVSDEHLLVSPADGYVQGYGLIEEGMVEQVKGINYPLHDFLGPNVARFLRKHDQDAELRTNVKGKHMRRITEKPLLFDSTKGDRIGEFKLGSSVVLVFQGKHMRSITEKPLLFDSTKGDRIGEFKLGSFGVLVFQAPRNFRFIPKPGSKIRYGEPLGDIIPDSR